MFRVSSNDFEKAAKEAVVFVMKRKYQVDVDLEDLQLVWFSHILFNKKCMLYSEDLGSFYAEATFNMHTNEIYVDIYRKESTTSLTVEMIHHLQQEME